MNTHKELENILQGATINQIAFMDDGSINYLRVSLRNRREITVIPGNEHEDFVGIQIVHNMNEYTLDEWLNSGDEE